MTDVPGPSHSAGPVRPVDPGDWVQVGDSRGVVVRPLPDTPEDHLAVWYGEADVDGVPLVRSVPVQYCRPTGEARGYH